MGLHTFRLRHEFFSPILRIKFTYSVKSDNTPYRVGDDVVFREINPATNQGTGRVKQAVLTYVWTDTIEGIKKGYKILGIGPEKLASTGPQTPPDTGPQTADDYSLEASWMAALDASTPSHDTPFLLVSEPAQPAERGYAALLSLAPIGLSLVIYLLGKLVKATADKPEEQALPGVNNK